MRATNWPDKPQNANKTLAPTCKDAATDGEAADVVAVTDGGRWKNREFLHRIVFLSIVAATPHPPRPPPPQGTTALIGPSNSKCPQSKPGHSTTTRSCTPIEQPAER